MLHGYRVFALSEKPEFASTCAVWSFSEWGCQIDGYSLDNCIQRYKNSASDADNFPLTWIAITDNNTPAAMASLKKENHPSRKDLGPWLASVFVHPEHRNKGLAQTLSLKVEQAAKQLGYKEIYLFSHSAVKLYEKQGYQVIGQIDNPMGADKAPDTLMRKQL